MTKAQEEKTNLDGNVLLAHVTRRAGTWWNFYHKAEFVLRRHTARRWRRTMHGIIYIVGLIVVLLAVLSFFGLR